MNRESITNLAAGATALVLWMLLCSSATFAQVPVDEYGNPLSAVDASPTDVADDNLGYETVILGATDLEELVGPIALYPDDLLAIVLPASTYPLQIVQAARFLEQLEADSSLQPDSDWDDSVVALLNYPDVMRLLDDDIDWTWQLGEAVVNQQEDVVAAVESFRDRAYAAGNLQSDEHQQVTSSAGIIEIVPLEDDVIYVPYYEPERVVVQQPTRVYHYYPRAYPVYYYPYPVGYSFNTGYFWGVTTAYRVGWLTDSLNVRHHSYWGHPYFGHHYYGHYYRRPSIIVYNNWYGNYGNRYSPNRHRDGDRWRPRRDNGARPGDKDKRKGRDGQSDSGVRYTNSRARDRNNGDRPIYADGPGYRDSSPNNRNSSTRRSNSSSPLASGTSRQKQGRSRTERKLAPPTAANKDKGTDRTSIRSADRRSTGNSIRFRERDQRDVLADTRERYRTSNSAGNRQKTITSHDTRRRTQSATTALAAPGKNTASVNNRSRQRQAAIAAPASTRVAARESRNTTRTRNSASKARKTQKQASGSVKNESRRSSNKKSPSGTSTRRSNSRKTQRR